MAMLNTRHPQPPHHELNAIRKLLGYSRFRFFPSTGKAKKRSESEECGNYLLHFFRGMFFTSSDGNSLTAKAIESLQKRKWPWKKSQIERERPHF